MKIYEKPVIIEAHNINKVFHVKSQDVLVLSEVSLSVHKGDFLVLFGPSGCGKSTLLHILLGLEPPTSGWVDFLGKSLYDEMDEDSRTEFRKIHIGMVFQQPNWIKALSVKNNIIFALRLSGCLVKETEEKAMAILETVGMEQWADYFPTELSSGQQQRVSLARAMATNPDILIADEPTGNLDFKSGQELMTILSRLNKDGKTIIMVTHDLEYLSFANRAISMFDGKIIEQVDDPKMLINKKDFLTKRAQL